jgi:hypothetical protein
VQRERLVLVFDDSAHYQTKKASCKPICFAFENINRSVYLYEKIIAVEVAIPVFSSFEEQPHLSK